MTDEITIRKAGPGDLELILPLVNAYRAFYKQAADPDAARSFMDARLQKGTSIVFLAMRDTRALGFAQIFETYSTVRLAPVLILEDLFVDPDERGNGVGTALLARAVELARESGAGGMFLETAYDNVTAQRVYERAGWMRENQFYKYNAPL